MKRPWLHPHRHPACLVKQIPLGLVCLVFPVTFLAGCGSLVAQDANQELRRGVAELEAGNVRQALVHLDRVVELQPSSEPYLWQRGIAQYLAGEYEAGRKQFELHRKVNPNDVENATWHFICVAAMEDVDAARKAFLPAPGDPRPPLEEVYQLYKGDGTLADVEAAVAAQPEGNARRDARFYADLYLGLLAHAEGKKEDAKRYLKAAAAVPDRSVMAEVARVSYRILIAEPESAKAESEKDAGDSSSNKTDKKDS